MPVSVPLGRLAAAAAAASLVSACAGRGVVMPRVTAQLEQFQSVSGGAPCIGLDSTPLPSMPRDRGQEFSIGVQNWYFPGPEPAPCWRRNENRGIGLIKWDLKIAQTLISQGRRFERAELVQRLENVVRNYGDSWDGNLASVRVVAADWQARDRRAAPSDPSVAVSFTATPTILTIGVLSGPSERERTEDVTGIVRAWLDGTLPNYGLAWDSSTFGLGDTVTRSVVERVFVQLRLYFSEP